MTTPSINNTVTDPGIGTQGPGKGSPIYAGTSELGTDGVLVFCGSKGEAIAAFGQGQLTEALCLHIDVAGAPVWGIKMPGSVSKAVSAVTKTSTGPLVTAAFDGYENYNVLVQITKAGILGTALFKFSLDNGQNYSSIRAAPSGGTFVPTSTKLTLTFAAGTYVLNEVYTLSTTAPMYGSGDVTTMMAAVAAQTTYTNFPYVTLCGIAATATASAAICTALDTAVTAQRTIFRYCRGIADFGSSDTTANLTSNAIVSKLVGSAYGITSAISSKPIEGFGVFKSSLSLHASIRGGVAKACTNWGRFSSGPLSSVTSCSYLSIPGSEDPVDNAYVMTAVKYPGINSIYLTHGLLMSGPGSDFKNFARGLVMDIACSVVYNASLQFLNSTVKTNPDGSISATDAARIESAVQGALEDALMNVRNDEGELGFVSDLKYTVDRTNNINTTNKLIATVAIRPLGDLETIETTLGFKLNV